MTWRIMFIVPVHGREKLATICLRQLRRTCDALAPAIKASAVVIGEGKLLDVADDLGFATVKRSNHQLGAKFNDGYQLATDPEFNDRPADYVVPCGSDDWIDPVIFRNLPVDRIGVFRRLAVVNPERTKIAQLRTSYREGAGIRIIPAKFLKAAGYRPAEEDRRRALDASTIFGLRHANGWTGPNMVPTVELDVHPLQIVDWKTTGEQLNAYETLRGHWMSEHADPFDQLAPHFPAVALEEMRAL